MSVVIDAGAGMVEAGESPVQPSLDDVLGKIRPHIADLSTRYHIAALGVFGSYVRGEQDRGSDIDLLVEFYEPPSLFKFIRLENELSDLAGIRVDLVMKSALKPGIGQRIMAEVRPV